MKNRKTKSMLLGLAMVASVASVGFASWIIATGDVKTETGNVSAEIVENKSVGLTLTWVTDEGGATSTTAPKIHFGKDKTNADQAPSWLQNDTNEVSNLEAYLKIEVSNPTELTVSDAIVVDFLLGEANPENDKFVKVPTTQTFTAEEFKSGSKVVTLKFDWGSLITSKPASCPEVYFNNTEANEDSTVNASEFGLDPETLTNAKFAEMYFNKVNEIATKGFTVTVTANAKSAK